ncbi:MAG: 16S rRNA (guanine(966)-N(2))-methyltransferase RsmD [Actinobacteria bacterium]|nr:16S rRNA (guanine(966)-N(2))-methyltransferase RsmD [Actinomycetota bacterium]MBM3712934.1 16S rRNA (guanine(966)-N(2))-methyltransferase RsmD [Actinomycetota bacterium]
MRVISGKFKGTKLKIPHNYDIRPTQDRVKESIFNVIGDKIIESKVLDLFTGSGSLGIEALSRGASLVYFVDRSIKSVRLIQDNLRVVKAKENSEGSFKIIKNDVLKFLKSAKDIVWDIIFIDPPYKIDKNIMEELFNIFSSGAIINRNSVLIYEYFFKRDISSEIKLMKVLKKTHFGDKIVSYISLL